MKLLHKTMLGIIAALGLAIPVMAAERAIIVLDGSGSMWAQIDGEARITIARETLSEVLSELPADLELGLMSYGHREKGNCGDIEMLVEPAANTGAAIAGAAGDINPKGMTPLSDAVRLAAEELRYTEEKATVILITDGLETCEVDPCALGGELEGQGIDFTAHVLGFGLSDEEGRQVACLAENTGGKYLSAQDGNDLVEALTQTVAEVAQAEPEAAPEPAPAPQPVVLEKNFTIEMTLAEGGDLLTDENDDAVYWELNQGGDTIDYGYGIPLKQIEPGEYELLARFGPIEQTQSVEITAEELASPYFVMNAGIVILRAYASEGEPVADGAALNVYYEGGDDYGYGEGTFEVPAGQVTVMAKVGQGEVSETFALAAGETVEKDLVAGVGLAVINGSYVEGMAIEDGGMAVNVYKAAKAIDGSREEVGYGYGPGNEYQLTPGDYVAEVRMNAARAEVPFTVVGGERVEVDVIIDAGVAALSMPEAKSFQVFSARKDIQGNREDMGYGYDTEYQTTLPEGDYVVVTRYDDDSETETAFSVVAGERVEVTAQKGVAKSKSK
ncbi:VWA domain-containing protein [uncultured Devosia sp.]|uniref:vWA domain-containing protein n=1 Tax=uncultured Devosia sp. TaxID=211434 RepID=UPI0026117081|nr:VWA domain-containing protein [uncultured Devosia sp.]